VSASSHGVRFTRGFVRGHHRCEGAQVLAREPQVRRDLVITRAPRLLAQAF
jgi:hypothetical protein